MTLDGCVKDGRVAVSVMLHSSIPEFPDNMACRGSSRLNAQAGSPWERKVRRPST